MGADGDVTIISAGASELVTHSKAQQDEKDGAPKDTPIWDKNDGAMGQTRSKDRLLAPEFVKNYIEIAKCLKPSLTEEACEMIGEEYAKLRSQDFENSEVARTQPVTARALETLIRLSTAHAKARLSKTVDAEDAETAIELVQFAYFKKVLNKPKKRRHASGEDGEEGEEAGEDEAAASDTENDQNVDNS